MARVSCWSFTSFNEEAPKFDSGKMKYLCYGVEVCPETKKQHYQCYVQLAASQRLSYVKKLLGEGHYEPSKGDPQSNIEYCRKDGKFSEFGVVSYMGKRNDLVGVSDMCKLGKSMVDIASEYPVCYMRYHKGIERLHSMYIQDRNFKPNVCVFYGESGTGKTKKVYDEYKDVYAKPNGPWWDGYNNNETVLLDDYDGYIQFRELLQLLDRYPHQVPYKGGYKKFTSKNICITSNVHPQYWYPLEMSNEVNKKALFRRIDVLLRF